MLRVIRRRHPRMHMLIYPVPVQGPEAAPGHRRGDPVFQPGANVRRADHRPRRRLARGPLGLQRGGSGAGDLTPRRSLSSPLSGTRRTIRFRFCRRPSRSHAFGCSRNGGADRGKLLRIDRIARCRSRCGACARSSNSPAPPSANAAAPDRRSPTSCSSSMRSAFDELTGRLALPG